VDHGVDGLGEDVEDTVEDHLRVGRDDVGTVTQTPGDGVEEPEEGEEGSRSGKGGLVGRSEGGGGRSSGADENPPDVED
jgi:hypothetical protein